MAEFDEKFRILSSEWMTQYCGSMIILAKSIALRKGTDWCDEYEKQVIKFEQTTTGQRWLKRTGRA